MDKDLKEIMQAEFTNYIGPGSSASHILNFKTEFPKILKEYSIESVNDAGCGLGWVRELCNGIEYKGFDILERENAEILDITTEVMPPADLIVCRDVLLHLPDHLVMDAIENFRESGSKYLLSTSWYKATSRPSFFNGNIINALIDLVPIMGEPLCKIEEPIDERFVGLWNLQ